MNWADVYLGLVMIALGLAVRYVVLVWESKADKRAEWRAMIARQALERSERAQRETGWYFTGEDK